MSRKRKVELGGPKQPADSYERFSEIYDLLGYHRFSRRSVEKTKQFMAESGLCVTRLLDVGCGTGHYAIAMASLGIQVEGVDSSPGMLRCARKNAASTRPAPLWREGSFTDFSVSGSFELITSWFDSLNHLTSDAELSAFFRRARRHLAKRGAMLFDVNTPAAFSERWTMSQYHSTKGYVLHQQGLADPQGEFGLLELEAFVKRGKGYERYKLPFVQRGLTPQILAPLLAAARFRDVKFVAFEPGEPLEEATRMLVSARA